MWLLLMGAMVVVVVIVVFIGTTSVASTTKDPGVREIAPTGKWTGQGSKKGDVTDDIYGVKPGFSGGSGPLGDTRQSPHTSPDLVGSAIQPGLFHWDWTQGVPADKVKWRFVGGLDKKVPRDWPSEDDLVMWNPFPGPGQRMISGHLISKWGELPVVNPPASAAVYGLFTTWQEGDTATNEFYAKNCKPLMLSRGMLGYKGPSKFCTKGQCHPAAGGYVWTFAGALTKSGWSRGPGGVITQQNPKYLDEFSTPKAVQQNIIGYLVKGIEIPPWYRRGPNSKYSLEIFKKYCTPNASPKPRCLPPGQLKNEPGDKWCDEV